MAHHLPNNPEKLCLSPITNVFWSINNVFWPINSLSEKQCQLLIGYKLCVSGLLGKWHTIPIVTLTWLIVLQGEMYCWSHIFISCSSLDQRMFVNHTHFLYSFSTGVQIDWSDHMVWWEEKKMWLKKTRLTLNNYGVQAGAKLHFTPCHKTLRLQLPDMQLIDLRVNFSTNVVFAVQEVCTELGKTFK